MSNVSANKIDKINSLGHHVEDAWFCGINFRMFDLNLSLETKLIFNFLRNLIWSATVITAVYKLGLCR